MDGGLNKNSLKNYNLGSIMTSKIRMRNTKYLSTLGRNARGETQEKVEEVIKLYSESKISQISSAENMILDLILSKNIRQQKATAKKYEKFITKHQANQPLKIRLTQKLTQKKAAGTILKAFKKHFEPKVEFKNLNKAQNQIEFNLEHIKEFDSLTLTALYPKLRNIIYAETRKLLIIKNNIKLTIGCYATFMKLNKETDTIEKITQTVKAPHIIVYSKDEVSEVLDKLFKKLEELFETMKFKQSGYSLDKIHYIFIESFSVKPVRGSSYIPTPLRFSNSRCGLINIKNDDNECFKWCMKYHQTNKIKNDDRI